MYRVKNKLLREAFYQVISDQNLLNLSKANNKINPDNLVQICKYVYK